jgi:hypothetical protein
MQTFKCAPLCLTPSPAVLPKRYTFSELAAAPEGVYVKTFCASSKFLVVGQGGTRTVLWYEPNSGILAKALGHEAYTFVKAEEVVYLEVRPK